MENDDDAPHSTMRVTKSGIAAATAAVALLGTPVAMQEVDRFGLGQVGLGMDGSRIGGWVTHTKGGEAAIHFMTGGIAGCMGAAAVFPIDLVKTRLQAQKGDGDEELKYKGGIHCFRTVLREEGPLGLYSGLSAQLIGVWPEKAMKLSANDFMRGVLADPITGSIPIPGQVLAGAFGGLCQTVFTNPLEIVKIQLQLGGASSAASNKAAMVPVLSASAVASMEETSVAEETAAGGLRLVQVVKDLGLVGLYRGVDTCAARDMFFSGLYFPLFATLKELLANHGHSGGVWLLIAATLAGGPAAYLSTPLDMIKTRQQAAAASASPGSEPPSAKHCLDEILAESGWRGLFTGGAARVIRSAPQFGVTLTVYDQLNSAVQQLLSSS